MKAMITFDGHFSGVGLGQSEPRTFEIALGFEVIGLDHAQLSLPLAKELLVQVAIAITDPKGFEELAYALTARKNPPGKPKLRVVRAKRKDGA